MTEWACKRDLWDIYWYLLAFVELGLVSGAVRRRTSWNVHLSIFFSSLPLAYLTDIFKWGLSSSNRVWSGSGSGSHGDASCASWEWLADSIWLILTRVCQMINHFQSGSTRDWWAELYSFYSIHNSGSSSAQLHPPILLNTTSSTRGSSPRDWARDCIACSIKWVFESKVSCLSIRRKKEEGWEKIPVSLGDEVRGDARLMAKKGSMREPSVIDWKRVLIKMKIVSQVRRPRVIQRPMLNSKLRTVE